MSYIHLSSQHSLWSIPCRHQILHQHGSSIHSLLYCEVFGIFHKKWNDQFPFLNQAHCTIIYAVPAVILSAGKCNFSYEAARQDSLVFLKDPSLVTKAHGTGPNGKESTIFKFIYLLCPISAIVPNRFLSLSKLLSFPKKKLLFSLVH